MKNIHFFALFLLTTNIILFSGEHSSEHSSQDSSHNNKIQRPNEKHPTYSIESSKNSESDAYSDSNNDYNFNHDNINYLNSKEEVDE